MKFRFPSWWNTPITWGSSVKASLVSLALSGVYCLIVLIWGHYEDRRYERDLIKKYSDNKEEASGPKFVY